MSNCHCGSCIFQLSSSLENGIKCRRDTKWHDPDYSNCRHGEKIDGGTSSDWEKKANIVLNREKESRDFKIKGCAIGILAAIAIITIIVMIWLNLD